MYIYEHKNWPNFEWETAVVLPHVSTVRDLLGRLIGKMETYGFDLRDEAAMSTLTQDIVKSSEIEGEHFSPTEVRSSIASHLGMGISGQPKASRHIDGVVEMMLDATQNYQEPLSKERLCDWHAALFPTGRSGMQKITVGDYRDGKRGPMQIVSGTIGKENVHFVAPDASLLETEMDAFIAWYNTALPIEPIIKSAVAHLWFVTIHPFADGNGRIARAISDSLLARADRTHQRFYSMSTQLMNERSGYYTMLEYTQKGGTDITPWIVWYFERLTEALKATNDTLASVGIKASFWQQHKDTTLNERQRKVIKKLLDGFEGKLQASKYAKITKVHRDTARRDLQDLIEKGVLVAGDVGGRSTFYELKVDKTEMN